jgi:hypothetical protein
MRVAVEKGAGFNFFTPDCSDGCDMPLFGILRTFRYLPMAGLIRNSGDPGIMSGIAAPQNGGVAGLKVLCRSFNLKTGCEPGFHMKLKSNGG